jgi:hypothetical protein
LRAASTSVSFSPTHSAPAVIASRTFMLCPSFGRSVLYDYPSTRR